MALTRFINGEVSAGLQHRTYVDPGLKDLTAPIINAALIWTASPLTTVRLNAATGIIETAVPGSSGVLTKAVTLEVQHDLLRNLSITLGGGYLASDYGPGQHHRAWFLSHRTARLPLQPLALPARQLHLPADRQQFRWVELQCQYLAAGATGHALRGLGPPPET